MQNTSAAPKPTKVDTPGMSYSFYREKDADLTAAEGRIEWFCLKFEVDPPTLEYDPEEPTAIMLTDSLLEWTASEGVSLDWLFMGSISGALAAYRERHKPTPETREWMQIVGGLGKPEQRMLLAGLTLVTNSDADIDTVMRSVSEQIAEYRLQNTGAQQ